MSVQAPDDTVRALTNLIDASEDVLQNAPIHLKLLLRGAIIDAKDLLAELQGGPRIDTHEDALSAIREEARKVG